MYALTLRRLNILLLLFIYYNGVDPSKFISDRHVTVRAFNCSHKKKQESKKGVTHRHHFCSKGTEISRHWPSPQQIQLPTAKNRLFCPRFPVPAGPLNPLEVFYGFSSFPNEIGLTLCSFLYCIYWLKRKNNVKNHEVIIENKKADP